MTSNHTIWVRSLGIAAITGAAGYGAYRTFVWWRQREGTETGYVDGKPFEIKYVRIDGKPVEIETARAFRRMQEAAAREGVRIRVISGFRTMAEQQYLYDCNVRCSCNNCNLAARPGHSNHQSGHALDLNTRDPAVGAWMKAHGGEYGFVNTVPGEPWHWEYWSEHA